LKKVLSHVIPVKTGIQTCPCENREPVEKTGFPASSAGQALLEFIPVKTGAGMTSQSGKTKTEGKKHEQGGQAH
jgi:hypothetical protein